MYNQNKRKVFRRIVSIFVVCIFFMTGVIMDLQKASASELSSGTMKDLNFHALKNNNKGTGKEVGLNKKKDVILEKNSSTLSVLNVKKNYKIEFSSSDTDILEVKQKSQTLCEYQGKNPGSATINVKISKPGFLFMPNNRYLQCKVTVSPRAVSICFTQKVFKMKLGNSRKLKLTTRPSISKEKAVFESSDTDVADVDYNGRVKAKSAGTTTITARISNGKTVKCKVIVSEKANKLKKQKNSD